MSQKILLVEGESDRSFFKEIIKMLNLDVAITVSTPQDFGSPRNGKIKSFALLGTLLEQLSDGSITHLAMIVDADFSSDHWGYQKTIQLVMEKINKSGYSNPLNLEFGLSFPHPDGLNNFGLWIMPDNCNEGMLEDWITQSITREESALLQHSINTVKNLPQPKKFKEIHTSKANIATWMAWQKNPGQGLDAVISNKLIDLNSPLTVKLTGWLKHIYLPSHETTQV